MKSFFYVLFIFLINPVGIYGQEEEVSIIGTDRPGFGEASSVVPHHRFQMENGIVYTWNENAAIKSQEFYFPSTIIRYGVLEHFELRLGFTLNQLNVQFASINTSSNIRVAPWVLGFKTQIARQKGALPEIALEGNLSLPVAVGQIWQDAQPAPYFYIPMTWAFNDRISLTCNYAMLWDGFIPEPNYHFTFTPGFVIVEGLSAFAEVYFFASETGGWRWGTDAGICWAITPQTQLDLSAGLGINQAENDGFVNLGFSFCLDHN